jgi:hypothetical protein
MKVSGMRRSAWQMTNYDSRFANGKYGSAQGTESIPLREYFPMIVKQIAFG